MKKYLLAISALLILNTVTYASSYPVNFEGKYDCNCAEVGTNVDFKGVMTLKELAKHTR